MLEHSMNAAPDPELESLVKGFVETVRKQPTIERMTREDKLKSIGWSFC